MNNQHEETNQNSAECRSLSLICLWGLSGPWRCLLLSEAFVCIYLTPADKRTALRLQLAWNNPKVKPKQRWKVISVFVLRPLWFCLAHKDSHVRKLMQCNKKTKAWFAKNAGCHSGIKTGGAGRGLVKVLQWGVWQVSASIPKMHVCIFTAPQGVPASGQGRKEGQLSGYSAVKHWSNIYIRLKWECWF